MREQQQYEYVEDGGEPAVHIQFNDAESRAAYEIAEWYAQQCRDHGVEPPSDVMRCLLKAAGMWQHAVELGKAQVAREWAARQGGGAASH